MSNRGSRWWRRISALAELNGDHDQKDIAATLGVSASTVSAWKNDGTPPQAESIVAAATAYSVDAKELFAVAWMEPEEPQKDDPKARRAGSRARTGRAKLSDAKVRRQL